MARQPLPRVSGNAKSGIGRHRITIGLASRTHLLSPPFEGEERAVREILKNFINGHWENGVTTGTSENPSDLASPVADYARADARQAEAAIVAAREAAPDWALSTSQRRSDVLEFVAGELLARRDELGSLLAREEGKTLPEAVAEVA